MSKSSHSARYNRLRELLVQYRREAGLTQAQLAEKLHKPQSFVSKYENGERRLDVVECLEVAEAIGTDPMALFEQLR